MSSTATAPGPVEPPTGLAAAITGLRAAREVVTTADPWSAGLGDLGDQIAALQSEIDALTGAAFRWTNVFAEQDGPADAGASSLAAWLRRDLRITGRDASRRVRIGRLLADLPATAKALESGEVGIGHIDVLATAARDLGPTVVAEAEPILLPVAQAADPDAVEDAVQHLRDTLDPDAADEAYVRALEKRDITIAKVGDLFQLRGVLDPVTGQSLKSVLYAMSKPTSKDDDRPAGQRKVDGLRQLCDERLRNGAPTDHGFRPQLLVTVTQSRLADATGIANDATSTAEAPDQVDTDGHEPAVLHGFGTIGDELLGQLACDAEQTEVTVDDAGNVLDVGRTKRLATPKQRIAVIVKQGGVCAAPGCRNTHLEIHHLVYWSKGGKTNVKLLAGYCTRCHHLIHRGLLVVKPDGAGGWVHEDRRRRRLEDRWRQARRATWDHLTALAHQVFDAPDDGDPPDDGNPPDDGDPPGRPPDPAPPGRPHAPDGSGPTHPG